MKRVKKQTAPKGSSKLEALAESVEQTYNHADSRVVNRQREVLNFELAATDEHIMGLRASLGEVLAKRQRIEARITGLTRVLRKR